MKKSAFFKSVACVLAAVGTLTFAGCDLFGEGTEGGESIPPAVFISQSVIELEVGQTVQLQALSTDESEVIWISSDDSVATVYDGLVTGLSAGETLVTAVGDKAQTSCTVKVKEKAAPTPDDGTGKPDDGTDTPAESEVFVLSLDVLTLTVGQTATLKATSKLKDEITWESSVPSIASVVNGKVTALKAGNTLITAKTETVSASCKVTVVAAQTDGGNNGGTTNPDDGDGDAAKDGYKLVWRDEFNGTSLDTTKWNYQTGTQDSYGSSTGPQYWGNDELQYYTQDAVTVSNGSLVITAKKQTMGDRPYTSGRILTRDKGSWTYGYFEARMKTPTGNGMWPAFWMLPQPSTTANTDNIYGGWPANGEIDIMEAKGRLANKVDTTLHFGKAWNEHEYKTEETTLRSNTDQWHTYAVEWTADYIYWFVDGIRVHAVNKYTWWSQDTANKGQSKPFDQPFYILLNLAVGGHYDNYVEPDAGFTQASMYVDYVRVYEKK